VQGTVLSWVPASVSCRGWLTSSSTMAGAEGESEYGCSVLMRCHANALLRRPSSPQPWSLDLPLPSMSSPAANDRRRYGFSCSVCRRKKVRCDGGRPACSSCSKAGIQCGYKPESADTRLLQQLQRANRRVLELEEQVRTLESSSGGGAAASIPESGISPSSHISANSSTGAIPARDAESDEEDVQESAFAKLGVDENGEVPSPLFSSSADPDIANLHRCNILVPPRGFILKRGSACNCDVRRRWSILQIL
jgi:hypothetical protein